MVRVLGQEAHEAGGAEQLEGVQRVRVLELEPRAGVVAVEGDGRQARHERGVVELELAVVLEGEGAQHHLVGDAQVLRQREVEREEGLVAHEGDLVDEELVEHLVDVGGHVHQLVDHVGAEGELLERGAAARRRVVRLLLELGDARLLGGRRRQHVEVLLGEERGGGGLLRHRVDELGLEALEGGHAAVAAHQRGAEAVQLVAAVGGAQHQLERLEGVQALQEAAAVPVERQHDELLQHEERELAQHEVELGGRRAAVQLDDLGLEGADDGQQRAVEPLVEEAVVLVAEEQQVEVVLDDLGTEGERVQQVLQAGLVEEELGALAQLRQQQAHGGRELADVLVVLGRRLELVTPRTATASSKSGSPLPLFLFQI